MSKIDTCVYRDPVPTPLDRLLWIEPDNHAVWKTTRSSAGFVTTWGIHLMYW